MRLHSIAYRATKAECLDLPDTIDIIRHVDLEPQAAGIYRGLVKDSYAELSKGEVTVTNVLTRLLRLSQLTGGFISDDESGIVQKVSDAKLKALEDILDATLQEDKNLVVIARFIPELQAICELLDKRHIRYSLIMGGVKDRSEQVERFQNDPEVSVVLFLPQGATVARQSLSFRMSCI